MRDMAAWMLRHWTTAQNFAFSPKTPIGEQGALHKRPARREDALVVVIQLLGVVVVSCVLTGCVGPGFAHSKKQKKVL